MAGFPYIGPSDDVYQLTDDEVAPDTIEQMRQSVIDRYPEVMKALAEHEQIEGAPTPRYWQLVDLARDMCRAAGYDPDQRVLDTQNAQRGPLGSTLVHATVPAWTLYVDAAEKVTETVNG